MLIAELKICRGLPAIEGKNSEIRYVPDPAITITCSSMRYGNYRCIFEEQGNRHKTTLLLQGEKRISPTLTLIQCSFTLAEEQYGHPKNSFLLTRHPSRAFLVLKAEQIRGTNMPLF
ncbi:uncharacterized protein A4U43_C05F22080 [Asparagus officinalis]|uniref:Uncharacterized protein n=1 Tax=Asparagus officinalis TaxID=4686 RepID=A0A5P1EU82_ASPOF|nr:uncharacterized protein A4U43_C05F22080 [Asparagus officinalis]